MARKLTLALTALFIVACGSDSPSEPEALSNTVTALIDGASFSMDVFDIATYGSNVMVIGGTDSQTGQRIDLNVINLTAPGTYPISDPPDPTSTVALASVTDGSGLWAAALGTGGQITITELSVSGASGTFFFGAGPVPGGTNTGTLELTQGRFDLTFN